MFLGQYDDGPGLGPGQDWSWVGQDPGRVQVESWAYSGSLCLDWVHWCYPWTTLIGPRVSSFGFWQQHSKGKQVLKKNHTRVFLGYPNNIKGYLIYDTTNDKILVSSNVIFKEEIFPFNGLDENEENNVLLPKSLQMDVWRCQHLTQHQIAYLIIDSTRIIKNLWRQSQKNLSQTIIAKQNIIKNGVRLWV